MGVARDWLRSDGSEGHGEATREVGVGDRGSCKWERVKGCEGCRWVGSLVLWFISIRLCLMIF